MEIRVLLADDHAVLRDTMRHCLERQFDIKVVAEADNGKDALRLAMERKPDVSVMDISMPDLDGINATRKLIAAVPGAKVLALSTHAERHLVLHMLEAGARGYIVKTSGISVTVEAIRAVFQGRTYLCREAEGAIAQSECKVGVLRQREIDVLVLVAIGNTSQEISQKLDIETATVEVYRRNILRKLGLHTEPELTQYAIRAGLISM